MAKLFFKYGTMKSGKSLDLIRTYDTYSRAGFMPLVIYPTTDTRSEQGKVSSRMVKPIPATSVAPGGLPKFVEEEHIQEWDVILVDEVQFFREEDVMAMVDIVDKYGVPVVAYGLKTDFRAILFEGSRALLEQADKIEEIKTICWSCGKKATHNVRYNERGEFQLDGEQVAVGDETYEQVCRKCYYKGKREAEEKHGDE